MAIKTLRFRASGESLLMHNGLLADPLFSWTQAIAKVTSKRNKTDADQMEIARLEWYGGLYLMGGKPCLPGDVIQATLAEAAKALKLGKATKRTVFVPDNYPLHFEGEEEWDGTEESLVKAWASGKYSNRSMVRVGMSKVARTRPLFTNWSVEFEIEFDDKSMNREEIEEIVRLAGRVGFGDWRPRHGRFLSELVK